LLCLQFIRDVLEGAQHTREILGAIPDILCAFSIPRDLPDCIFVPFPSPSLHSLNISCDKISHFPVEFQQTLPESEIPGSASHGIPWHIGLLSIEPLTQYLNIQVTPL